MEETGRKIGRDNILTIGRRKPTWTWSIASRVGGTGETGQEAPVVKSLRGTSRLAVGLVRLGLHSFGFSSLIVSSKNEVGPSCNPISSPPAPKIDRANITDTSGGGELNLVQAQKKKLRSLQNYPPFLAGCMTDQTSSSSSSFRDVSCFCAKKGDF